MNQCRPYWKCVIFCNFYLEKRKKWFRLPNLMNLIEQDMVCRNMLQFFFQSLNFAGHTAVSKVTKCAKIRSFFDITLIALLIKNQSLKTFHPMVILFISNIVLLTTLNVFWHKVIFKGCESTQFWYFAIFTIYTISVCFSKYISKKFGPIKVYLWQISPKLTNRSAPKF